MRRCSHHIGGELQPQQTIFLNVASGERAIVFNLYKPVLSNISIRIITPTGINSGDILIREGYSEGNIGKIDIKFTILDQSPSI